MPFFDFHCHPGLKPQFSNPLLKPSPWENIRARLALFTDVNISINKLFNEVLNSQSSLTQLFNADVKLIGLVLHAPEQKIAQALGEKKIVNKGKVHLINKEQLAYIASGVHGFELINAELEWLQKASSPQGYFFKLVGKTADFDETASGVIHGVIIVEGLHCFFSDAAAMDAKEVFTENFRRFTDEYTVLAINICHMQQNVFCNHAYGMQFFNPGYFYPVEKGITTWGREIIQSMIEKKILVDIKHMSLCARWELYSLFKNSADDNEFIQPIICTHAGTTGLSVRDRAKYLLNAPVDKGSVYEVTYLKPKSKHDTETYYNCSSINLYDEEIAYILLSGGMIGLSFDQRILGFADENVLPQVMIPHDVEYISRKEADFFLGPNPTALLPWTDDASVWTSEDFEYLDPSLYITMHRRFLINQLIHILWVADKHPGINVKTAATQICIGSDFDGLINAIDCCKQATGFSQLKKDMYKGLSDLFHQTNLSGFIPDTNAFLDDIFYHNGKNFILKRLAVL